MFVVACILPKKFLPDNNSENLFKRKSTECFFFSNALDIYFLVNFSFEMHCGIYVFLELPVLPQADTSFCCYLMKYLTVIRMHFLIWV